jgi:hypothetical protein
MPRAPKNARLKNATKRESQCPLTPELREKLLAGLREGDWPDMVAMRNGVSGQTLTRWVLKGLDEGAGEPWASFADEVVAIEVDVSGQLVKIIMDSAMGRRRIVNQLDEEGHECHPPSVGDAKWMLTRRFQWLWAQSRETGLVAGRSLAEVVAERIEQIETEHLEQVRKLLRQLPSDAKREAMARGLVLPR